MRSKKKIQRKLNKREREKAAQIKPIVDFDVLFLPETSKTLGQIIPTLASFEVNHPLLMGPSTWNNPDLVLRTRQYLEKAVFVDAFFDMRDSNVVKTFQDKFRLLRGEDEAPNRLTALGYDIGLALNRAYLKSGTLPSSREELRSRLVTLGEIEGVMGRHIWDATRDTLAEIQFFNYAKGAFSYEKSEYFRATENPLN